MKSVTIERERYVDSVLLLFATREVKALPGIREAVVALATPANREALARIGFVSPDLDRAGANDLVIALEGETAEALGTAAARAREILARREEHRPEEGSRPATLREAIRLLPGANLVLLSVPGAYAAREALLALRKGLHVMLFSDNVPLEDEIALKKEALERGLLLMGPDCGTAIVAGKPLGFANVVRRGRIGVVGASGTGIQEVTSLVDRLGGGISHALGTGGHDLSEAVGGVMAEFCLRALAQDEATEAIVLLSKRPAPAVGQRLLSVLEKTGKPGIVHFLGDGEKPPHGSLVFPGSLAAVARWACEAVGLLIPLEGLPDADLDLLAEKETKGLAKGQTSLRGYFCGGTLAQEAWHLLARHGFALPSNVATDPKLKVEDEGGKAGDVLLDLGDDRFTRGRPHPMIEPSLRDERIPRAAEDPRVAVILVDLVLGHGAHPDPAAGLAEAAARAKKTVAARGGSLSVVASVTGTEGDPQGYSRQRRTLEEAGVRVLDTNEEAAHLAVAILRRLSRGGRRPG